MPAIHHPTWLAIGLGLFLLGLWMWRWSARNTIVDVKGAAIGAAWQGVKQGRLDVPEDLKNRFNEVASESSNAKRAAKVGGMAARHVMAKVVGIGGLIGMLAGLAIAAAGIWIK